MQTQFSRRRMRRLIRDSTVFVLELHGPSMFAVKAKIYGVIYNQSSSIALMKHLVIGQRRKAPNFSTFHWSPRGSLVSIGQHFVTTRVVHLLNRPETSLITEADLIAESNQAVRAVHSCNSNVSMQYTMKVKTFTRNS